MTFTKTSVVSLCISQLAGLWKVGQGSMSELWTCVCEKCVPRFNKPREELVQIQFWNPDCFSYTCENRESKPWRRCESSLSEGPWYAPWTDTGSSPVAGLRMDGLQPRILGQLEESGPPESKWPALSSPSAATTESPWSKALNPLAYAVAQPGNRQDWLWRSSPVWLWLDGERGCRSPQQTSHTGCHNTPRANKH